MTGFGFGPSQTGCTTVGDEPQNSGDTTSLMSELMKTRNAVWAKVPTRLHYPLDVILTCMRHLLCTNLRNVEGISAFAAG